MAGEMVKRGADVDKAMKVAEHMAKSGYFADARDVSKAVTKILFGQSIGLDPFSCMSGIIIVQGRPTLSAGTIARLIKDSGKYRWTIDEHTNDVCTLTVYEKVDTGPNTWEWIKHAPFTRRREEYKHLFKNPTWQQYPKNMLFARTITDVGKMICPEVFGGSIYTPDEIPSDVRVDGATLEVTTAPDIKVVESKRPTLPPDDEVIEGELKVVANEEDIEALAGELAAESLGLTWVKKVLGVHEVEMSELSPDDVGRVRKALTTYRQANKGK